MSLQLPIEIQHKGRKTGGYCTPKEDTVVQKMCVPPRRVLPVIFLPGIMGSNLRLSAERQSQLRKSNNVSWQPDRIGEMWSYLNATPARRQLLLDPRHTEVDIFSPEGPTGNPKERSEERHKLPDIKIDFSTTPNSQLLVDDPPTVMGRRNVSDKARARGWSEVYFGSYRTILEKCEQALNSSPDADVWNDVFGFDPIIWGANPTAQLPILTKADFLSATANCFFPVHAMGYNWLRSNAESAEVLKDRIESLIRQYKLDGFGCEKVIILTHSMGGLVARALIDPVLGGLASKVLGVVHGAMPAVGAPAAYKRMRCGFEEQLWGFHPAPKILGNSGDEVTAVLGNSVGGLQLLPSKSYGNGWLQIRQGNVLFEQLPRNGDPYEEIYKLKGRWYGLLREDWLNPAGDRNAGIARTCSLLDEARAFHDAIAETYHSCTYAHYGADEERPSWEHVTWHLSQNVRNSDWRKLAIVSDSRQGFLELQSVRHSPNENVETVSARLAQPQGPGDQTVPVRSADHQLRSGKLKAVFKQAGYEHQASYDATQVVRATLYSLVRIAQTMRWEP
jgi:hypothetical protein